jgi:hypothetical protein
VKGWFNVMEIQRPHSTGSFLYSVGWRGLVLILLLGVIFEEFRLTSWMINSPSDTLLFGGIAVQLVTVLMAFWVVSFILKRRP